MATERRHLFTNFCQLIELQGNHLLGGFSKPVMVTDYRNSFKVSSPKVYRIFILNVKYI